MHQEGLIGKRPKEKYHSYKDPMGKFMYLRFWIGITVKSSPDHLSLRPNSDQIKRMLEEAFKKFPRLNELIFHSDQSRQYQYEMYRTTGIIQSMSRKGNCYDNCIIETFFGRMKNEMYYGYKKVSVV